MELVISNRIPTADSFYNLYESTGWNEEPKKNKEVLHKAILNSWYQVSAFCGDELIGFGRVISDGKLHAFIVDLIIAPSFQGKGLGTELLTRLVDQVKVAGIDDIQLFCARGKKEFYLKNSFEERPNDGPGMQYKQ